MKIRLCMTLCLILSPFSLFAQSPSNADALSIAAKTIRPEEIRAHIRFLSDSLLEGRAPGTPGYDVAAR